MLDKKRQAIKVLDFSVSKIQRNSTHSLLTKTGTLQFNAPEIFSSYFYSREVDLWSVGIILYCLISGNCPFQSEG
jgi:serine/threonine protein kinase